MHSSHSRKLIATLTVAVTMTMGSSRLAAQSSEISNFATGEFIDWAALQSFPPDPQDTTGPLNVLDWTGATIAHDANYFYLRYTEAGPTRTTWAQTIYLDTDSNPSTGLQSGLAIGADHLIQGRLIYTYTGDATGSVWSWEHTGSMNGLSSPDLITRNWRFDRDAIGNPSSFDLAFVGSNEAYGGDTEDLYPDGVYSEKSDTRFFTYSTTATGNTAPQAIQPDTIRTPAGTPVQFTLEGSDPDGDPLTYQLVFDPLEGTISGTAPTLTYTPRAGFSGFDLIGFIANDGTSDSAETLINIEVIGDGAPYGADQYLITDENVPIDIYLDGTDPDGQPLTYTILEAPTAPVGT